MRVLLFLLVAVCSINTQAENVFRIEVGRNYEKYSDQDLRRRVWELERAVFQLQQRVFHLEGNQMAQKPAVDSWICRVSAFTDEFTGIGGSKAVATAKAIENCTQKHHGMHCKDVKCEN